MKTDSVNYVCKKINDDLMNENSFDDYISSSLYDDNFEKEKIMAATVLSLNKENFSSEEEFQVEEKSYEGLVLKELPKHLNYVFLDKERSKLVIIEANLTIEKDHKVVETLRKNHEAIAWSVEDLKGINPSICMHKILMEENAKTSIEHQRRLNLVMKEVVQKEVLKWMNTGFIYAILDSPWVSLAHVVPKNGGMTVIRNEKNELIPTRTMTGWRVCIDYRKLNTATRNDHFPLPIID